ncbi:MAG: hypothetical protein LBS63_04980 [Prevotellaceae bacterium]|jgi:hypothetical protein|nr:hypothetical protein [Prevotellaceae bacterium]
MLIVNPIYDVAFKALLQEERIAKFFIGTLIGENVAAVEPAPQEHVYYEDGIKPPTLFRMDFVAVIRTDKGEERRILVEMQKAGHPSDVPRFRRYLGNSYANDSKSLPITTIYVLGFTLDGVDTPCLKVARGYYDLVNQKPISEKNYFVEQLSHDCYVVQAPLVKARYQTHIDQLLNVFQQANFVPCEANSGYKTLLIDYDYDPRLISPEVKLILDKLHYLATDPAERKSLDDEIYYRQYVEDTFGKDRQKIVENIKALEEQEKAMKEQEKAIGAEKEKNAEQATVLAAALARIAELEQRNNA